MPFLIGDVSEQDLKRSTVRHITHIRDVQEVREGTLVEFFGYAVRWDVHCVSEKECLRWRSMGDPSCDAAINAIFRQSSSVGKDLLESLQDHARSGSGSDMAAVFLVEVSQVPPPGIRADAKDVLLARAFFLDYAIQIMQALLHYSLAGGFASPRIVKTLHAASYLIPPERRDSHVEQWSKAADDRTFSRLLETMQFVLDVMGCVAAPPDTQPNKDIEAHSPDSYLLPGGEGWKACVRVRMLHAVARRRARQRLTRELNGRYDEEADGVPISQEDMAATLASFSTVPIFALRRLHLHADPDQVRAYLAVWRHVGFYLGVSPDIMTQYLSSPKAADKFLASVTLGLFSSDEPLDPRAIPTVSILHAVSNRPPSSSTFEYNCAVTRYLVGDVLADHLGLPQTWLRMRIKLHWSLFVQRVPILFGKWYPRQSWVEKRRQVMREGLPRSVRWSLGMRRTTFRPRTDVRTSVESESDGLGGDLSEHVKEAEAVQPDFAGGRVLARRWKEVVYEMAGVCAGTALVITITAWMAISRGIFM